MEGLRIEYLWKTNPKVASFVMKYSTIKGKKNGENPFDLEVEFDIGLKGFEKRRIDSPKTICQKDEMVKEIKNNL